mmetsp:Transcript_31678/g.53628  ORF Transcript_31678/g.53628 Transcript_31678/m.53628 type:complete len:111 (-) Transcript_31678:537-869(-)
MPILKMGGFSVLFTQLRAISFAGRQCTRHLPDIHARLPPRSPSSSPERKRAKVASAPPPNPQAVARKPDSIQPAGWGGFLARSQKQQTKADAIDWNDLGKWDTKTLLKGV